MRGLTLPAESPFQAVDVSRTLAQLSTAGPFSGGHPGWESSSQFFVQLQITLLRRGGQMLGALCFPFSVRRRDA